MSRQFLDESDLKNIINFCACRGLSLSNSGDYQGAQLVFRGVGSFISIFSPSVEMFSGNGRCGEWLNGVLYSLYYGVTSKEIDADDIDRHLIRLSDFCRLNDFDQVMTVHINFEFKLPDNEFWDMKY